MKFLKLITNSLLFAIITTAPVMAKTENKNEKINILINTVKDNLFSSWYSGGHESDSFFDSEKGSNNINISDSKLSFYRNGDNLLIIPKQNKQDNYFNKNFSYTLVKTGNLFEGDINDFIIPPDENYEEILNLALQRYKLFFPSSRAFLGEKKFFRIEGKESAYLVTGKNFLDNDLNKLLKNSEDWQQILSIPFELKMNEKSYQFIMLGNDPYNSFKLQQTLKEMNASLPSQNTLKLSYGNLFTSSDSKKHKMELESFKENNYQAVLPSSNDLQSSLEKFKEINNISPLVAANISHKEEGLLKPYIVTRAGNMNIAITGVVDEFLPKATGTVNKISLLKFNDYSKSLEETMKKLLNDSKIDLVIVLSNIVSSGEKADEIRKVVVKSVNNYPQKQVLFFPLNNDLEFYYRTDKLEQHNSYNDPEMLIEVPLKKGLYSFNLDIKNKYISELNFITHKISKEKPIDKKMLELNSAMTNEIINFTSTPANGDTLLPDIRDLKKYMENQGLKFENDQYRGETLATMVSNILLEKYPSEISINKNTFGNGNTIGKISKSFAQEWFNEEDDNIVLFTLNGDDLSRLSNINKDIKIFNSSGIIKFNGINLEKNIIRGREINPKELYRIVTTESVYNNLLLENVISKTVNIEKKSIKLKEVVMDYFLEMLKKYQVEKTNEFSESYYKDYCRLFTDKSDDLNNQWLVSLKTLEFNYNRGQINNNDKYSQVKDSRVNAPNSSDIGFSGKLNSLYDTRSFSWENTLLSTYNQSFIEFREGNQIKNVDKKGNDDISLTTDMRLKFISINLLDQKIRLVPFVNSNYSTEFKPTKNPETNKENNRRSELNNSVGMVFYPGFIDEVRAGLLERSDFSSQTAQNFTPGWFTSFIANYQLANFALNFDGSYRYYFPSPLENKDQLGAFGELNGKIEFPLFDKLKISLNINTFLFLGNQELRNSGFGYGFNTFVGLGYSFDFKPAYSSYY